MPLTLVKQKSWLHIIFFLAQFSFVLSSWSLVNKAGMPTIATMDILLKDLKINYNYQAEIAVVSAYHCLAKSKQSKEVGKLYIYTAPLCITFAFSS